MGSEMCIRDRNIHRGVALGLEDGRRFSLEYSNQSIQRRGDREELWGGLIAVLKREPSAIFKAKSNPSVYILAAKLLLMALKDSLDWPEAVAKV